MTETVTIRKLIEALRDTAEKATSLEKVTRTGQRRGNYGIEETYEYEETNDKYSRDWIAGRILGMADTLAAMTTEKSTETTN